MDPHKTDDIISTLPTENGWLSNDNYPLYYYQGFWYHDYWLRGAIKAQAQSLPAQATDIILACNPKCGTTWLKALSFAIITRTRFTRDENPLRFTNPHDLVHFLEAPASSNLKTLEPKLPLVSTHLPYTNLPSSILDLECKMVYICRDPKDAFVSLWQFAHKMCLNVTDPIPLEEAFDLFCRGASTFGPYWDHVLGYWKAFLDRPDKILFLKYDDMMMNGAIEEHMKRLAEFMGYPFSIEEENEGVTTRIVEMCSFQSLSNLSVNKGGEYQLKGSNISITNDAFFRKAKVGDWKNYLSEEMANKIDQITIEKLGAYGLTL